MENLTVVGELAEMTMNENDAEVTISLTGLVQADINPSDSICIGCCWESLGQGDYFCHCTKMNVDVSISKCLGKNKGQLEFDMEGE